MLIFLKIQNPSDGQGLNSFLIDFQVRTELLRKHQSAEISLNAQTETFPSIMTNQQQFPDVIL